MKDVDIKGSVNADVYTFSHRYLYISGENSQASTHYVFKLDHTYSLSTIDLKHGCLDSMQTEEASVGHIFDQLSIFIQSLTREKKKNLFNLV